jgi:hypothetical protein
VIARHISEERGLIAHLVGIACRGVTIKGIRNMLEITNGNSQAVALASRLVKSMPGRISFRQPLLDEGALLGITIHRGIDAERSLTEAQAIARAFSEPGSDTYNYIYESLKATIGLPNRLVRDAYQARLIAWLRECKPYLNERGDPRMVQARFRTGYVHMRRKHDLLGIQAWFVMLGEELGDVAIIYQTRCAILLAAINVFESKNKSGRFPTRISNIDPCDRQPLRYERLSKGFIILTRGAAPKAPEGCEPIAPLNEELRSKLDFTYRG